MHILHTALYMLFLRCWQFEFECADFYSHFKSVCDFCFIITVLKIEEACICNFVFLLSSDTQRTPNPGGAESSRPQDGVDSMIRNQVGRQVDRLFVGSWFFLNPLHPNISIHIFHDVLYTFLDTENLSENQELFG